MREGLSIIIPTKDRANVFAKTLDAVFSACKGLTSEIIVVNDSKTETISIPSLYENKVRVFSNSGIGVASARNLGVKHSNYPYLLFLDDDILISSQILKELMVIHSQNPEAAINLNWKYPDDIREHIKETQFGRYLIENGFTTLKGWSNNLKWNDTETFEVDLIASYFLFISRRMFDLIGGYDESFPHAGAEDFDFARRLKKAGVKGICNPLCTVWHNEEDRITLLPWLERKQRAAETRRIAATLGYKEMSIEATKVKVVFVRLAFHLKFVLFTCLRMIPKAKRFDFLYFKLVNILLALYLYDGFFKVKRSVS